MLMIISPVIAAMMFVCGYRLLGRTPSWALGL